MSIMDRRFMDARLVMHGVVDDFPNNIEPYNGLQYIVGENPSGVFEQASTNDIAIYKDGVWRFYKPKVTDLELMDINNNRLIRWNGMEFVTALQFLQDGSLEVIDEYLKKIVLGGEDKDTDRRLGVIEDALCEFDRDLNV